MAQTVAHSRRYDKKVADSSVPPPRLPAPPARLPAFVVPKCGWVGIRELQEKVRRKK